MTCFQLFDVDNPVNKLASHYLFTTEGHIFPLLQQSRRKPWAFAYDRTEIEVEVIINEVEPNVSNNTHSNVSFNFYLLLIYCSIFFLVYS